MSLTKEEVHDIALEVVHECRTEVNDEIKQLHKADAENAWSEEKAKKIAAEAADLAVKQITTEFYAGVGKKTVTAIGASIVVVVIMAKDYLKSLIGIK